MSQRLLLELWNKSIETQMRLTQLSARSRQLSIAILAAALVGAVLTIDRTAISIAIGSRDLAVSTGVLVLLIAVGAVALLRMVDRQHELMLAGAMKFAEDLEEQHVKPGLDGKLTRGLTQAIALATDHRDERTRSFYTWGAAVPAAAALLILIGTNVGNGATAEAAAPRAEVMAMPEEAPAVMASQTPTVETTPAVAPAPLPAAPSTAAPTAPAPTTKTTTTAPVGTAKNVTRPAATGKAAAATTTAATPAAAAPTPAKAEVAAAPAEPAPPAAPAPEPKAEPPAPKAEEPAPKPAEPAPPAPEPAPPPAP